MRETGALKLILPELDACYGIDQNKYHVYDIYYHSIYSCDSAPKHDQIIRLAALLHDIGKLPTRRLTPEGDYSFYNHEVVGEKITKKIMRRLKFSNEQIDRTANLIINHMFHYTDEWTDGAVRRFMRKVGLENMNDVFSLRVADRKGNGSRKGLPAPIETLKKRIEKIIDDQNAITVRDLKINGTILMERYGLKSGPIIGKVLHELLELVLDDPAVNNPESLMEKSSDILNRLLSEEGQTGIKD
jgi:poly(A) polymerase/tRNA nucleotidyltransferase (CCA-adding enzyme)